LKISLMGRTVFACDFERYSPRHLVHGKSSESCFSFQQTFGGLHHRTPVISKDNPWIITTRKKRMMIIYLNLNIYSIFAFMVTDTVVAEACGTFGTCGDTVVTYVSETEIAMKRDDHSSLSLALITKTPIAYVANKKWVLMWLVADCATKRVP
jgi:hypothetical protein